MSKLGFTFYPKDWWTSDTFYVLSPFERYIYLELLFMMYDNDGYIFNDKARVERRLMTTIKDDVWNKLADLMVKEGDQITNPSVNKRLRRTLSNRKNGKNGGAPKGNKNASKNNPNNPISTNEKNNLKTTKKQPKTTGCFENTISVDFITNSESNEKQPKQPKKTTQNNPPFKREREREYKIKDDDIITPSPTIFGSDITTSIDSLMEDCLSDKIYFVEYIHRNFNIDPNALPLKMKSFNDYLKSTSESIKCKKDYRSHFQNWLRKQPITKPKMKQI